MDIRDELATCYQWLRQYGYNDSHSGNISARNDSADDVGHFWVTPTGACADNIKADDFVAAPVHGHLPTGASGDANLHQLVYQKNPEVCAIIHSHCPHVVALTLNGKDFTPPDFEGQLYFPVVPVITVPYASYFKEAAPRVADILTASVPAEWRRNMVTSSFLMMASSTGSWNVYVTLC